MKAGAGAGAGPNTDRQSDSLQYKILPTVYRELSSKAARNKNAVLSGLPLAASITDEDLFASLHTDNMHLKRPLSQPDDSVKRRPTDPNSFALFKRSGRRHSTKGESLKKLV